MGQNSSKGKEQVVSDLERRLVAAVIARQKTGDGKVPPSFDAIALKFPTIRRAFRQLRNVFDKFDADRTNTIDLQEMKVSKHNSSFDWIHMVSLFVFIAGNEGMSVSDSEIQANKCKSEGFYQQMDAQE
jgi:hypothetical protein